MKNAFLIEQTAIPIAGSDDGFPVRRVYCVGRNYAAHAREMGFDPDREPPFFFLKPADAIVHCPPGTAMERPFPTLTQNFHFEAELVVAIGRGGAGIAVEDADSHIFGYAVGLDMTRRDLQIEMRDRGRPWEIGKAVDNGAPVGTLHRVEETGLLSNGEISLQVDGEVRQHSNLSHLIWSIPEMIAKLSTLFRLEPGDLIFSGTPEGVGPVQPGQLIEAGFEGLSGIAIRYGSDDATETTN